MADQSSMRRCRRQRAEKVTYVRGFFGNRCGELAGFSAPPAAGAVERGRDTLPATFASASSIHCLMRSQPVRAGGLAARDRVVGLTKELEDSS